MKRVEITKELEQKITSVPLSNFFKMLPSFVKPKTKRKFIIFGITFFTLSLLEIILYYSIMYTHSVIIFDFYSLALAAQSIFKLLTLIWGIMMWVQVMPVFNVRRDNWLLKR